MNNIFGNNTLTTLAEQFNMSPAILTVVIVIISLWTLVWKGLALWKSARSQHTLWFVLFLIVNTVGLLEIIYLLIQKNKAQQKTKVIR